MFAASKPVREAFAQRIFACPRTVDRHSGGFVEYYEIFVFIYYIDRKIDRKEYLKKRVRPGERSVRGISV